VIHSVLLSLLNLNDGLSAVVAVVTVAKLELLPCKSSMGYHAAAVTPGALGARDVGVVYSPIWQCLGTGLAQKGVALANAQTLHCRTVFLIKTNAACSATWAQLQGVCDIILFVPDRLGGGGVPADKRCQV
jgi:hypothetical protein